MNAPTAPATGVPSVATAVKTRTSIPPLQRTSASAPSPSTRPSLSTPISRTTPPSVTYGGDTETAVLVRLIQQQKEQALRDQQQYARMQQAAKLTNFGVLQSEVSQRRTERYIAIEFYAVLALLIGLAVYIGTIYYTIRIKYQLMLAGLERAASLKTEAYDASSPFFVALAYEYPFLSSIKFRNSAFPVAVVNAYYTDGFSQQIIEHPEYVEAMFKLSQSNSDLQAHQIVCDVFGYASNDLSCITACPGPVGTSWAEYAGAAIGLGGQGAFIGTGFFTSSFFSHHPNSYTVF